MGPLVLVLLSALVSDLERAPRRARGRGRASSTRPRCATTSERQTWTITPAPPDHEQQLTDSKLGDPVVVIAADFERDLAAGRPPRVEVVGSSANQRAQAATGRVLQLLRGFNQEQAMLRLACAAWRRRCWTPVQVEERDLADPATRAAQLGDGALLRADGGAVWRIERGAGHHRRRARARLAGAAADEPHVARRRWCWASGRRWQRWHADRGAELPELPARAVAAAQRVAGRAVPLRPREARCSSRCCCRWPARWPGC
jgi:hypothetical protein